jgi:electron transfer flavoprotein alpha subunit
MTPDNTVVVFVEVRAGVIADVSRELIGEAARLAARLGGGVDAVAIGHGLRERLPGLGGWGCRRVFYAEDPRLEHYTSVPYARILAAHLARRRPHVVLFGATVLGRDLAPRVASALRCGLTADCTALAIGSHDIKGRLLENVLYQIRPAFGGNIVATIVSPESRPSMATVREGVMRLAPPDPARLAEVVDLPVELQDDDLPTEVIEVIRRDRSVDLRRARVIVAAGMGASDPQALELVRELARTIGAAVAASRPVVDSGVLPREHQVGQTGVTVRPNLYIACGISGQIQHRAGMADSKRIIAINRDPAAPIFDIAHYGIVGDVRQVLPRMIRAYRQGG